MIKKCVICGSKFNAATVAVMCCSDSCKRKRSTVLKLARREKMDKTPRKCIVCGKEFIPYTRGHKCCSQQCNSKYSSQDYQHLKYKIDRNKEDEKLYYAGLPSGDSDWICYPGVQVYGY